MKDFAFKINGHNYNVQIDDVNEASTLARVVVNGNSYDVEIEDTGSASKSTKPQVAPAPKTANSAMVTPSSITPSPRATVAVPQSGYTVNSPLPGTVLALKVAVGDQVSVGQTLLVLEAMKMENNIDANRAGTVQQILVQQGATVKEGDQLIVIG